LTCPTADHLHAGAACEKCYGGKEHHCLLQNCRGNLLESLGYALRSSVARRLGLFARNVTLFVALSQFARQRLVGAGYNAEQIAVLPNMVQPAATPADPAAGTYVSFAGRLSAEKDVPTLLAAAGKLPELQVRLAGGGPLETSLRAAAPGNAQLIGRVATEDMPEFYRRARCHVLCSSAFEMCPLTILEAMSQGVPVVASAIGGVDELVEDGVTGLLFEPGNVGQLAEKLKLLWHDDQLCRRLGAAAAQRVRQRYSPAVYFGQLMSIYREAAIRIHGALPRCFEAFPPQQQQPAVQETAV
jgi:glycosyltransferase involved in cell wall biosynthesis